jgi:hypothetical protein
MKLTTGILVLGMAAGTAWGQNPDVIENTRNTMKAVEQKKAMDSNAALAASQGQPTKPAAPVSTKKVAAAPAKPASGHPKTSAITAAHVATKSAPATAKPVTPATATKAKKKTSKPAAPATKAVLKPARPKQKVAVKDKKSPEVAKNQAPRVINLTGRRDPFLSPVVNRSMIGSGCSMGKKCLAIGQISLKGVVKAEAGMIAVVVNAMDKAYFLRENDPVFNGYVVKITGDSIIFKETVQDRLGKSFTREVTKKITTPAV